VKAAANGHANAVLRQALDYLDAGLSILPVARDGSKGPDVSRLPHVLGEDGRAHASWKPFEKELALRADVEQWFKASAPPGIGVIGGAVSGALETIDFDVRADELFPEWCELVEAQAPGLVKRLSVARTPRGYHVRYRCPDVEVPGNTKLAEETGPDPKTGKVKLLTLIETRGEGGYAVAPGSPAECHETGRLYLHYSGPPLERVQVVGVEERELLINAARAFNRAAPQVEPKTAARRGGGLYPGDDYKQRGPDWLDLLAPHGWSLSHRRGEVLYLKRPDKSGKGCSATANHCRNDDGQGLLYIFSSNAAPFDNGKTYSKFAAYAFLNHGADFKAAAKALKAEGYGDPLERATKTGGRVTGGGPDGGREGDSAERVPVLVEAAVHRTVAAAQRALIDHDVGVFQQNGRLVHVRRDATPPAFLTCPPGVPVIQEVSQPHLMVRLSAVCQFQRQRLARGELVAEDVQPPPRVVAAVAETPNAFHPLAGIVTAPTFRPDGSLIDRPGYDLATGLYYDNFGVPKLDLPDLPARGEALRSLQVLRALLKDFPFEKPCHEAAAIAALLTVVGRYSFEGNVPLFLVDANRAGTGKGLLVDALGVVTTGVVPASMANVTDEAEMRKRLMAVALECHPIVKIDNVGEFDRLGTPSLDSAITAGVVSDRILGSNTKTICAAIKAVFFATGNNVQISGDLARRVAHIRLLTDLENPEERPGLLHPDLLGHARQWRADYLGAALCILRAWFVAGRPSRTLPSWGSFDGWSAVIRQCLVWLDLPDPHETRTDLREMSDAAGSAFVALSRCWKYADPGGEGVTADQLLKALDRIEDGGVLAEEKAGLRAAVCELCAGRGNDLPSPKSLGRRLTSLRGRVCGDRQLDCFENRMGTKVWAFRPVAQDAQDGTPPA
jgi:Bifunctional DNA primase/polymerase, N-terminal